MIDPSCWWQPIFAVAALNRRQPAMSVEGVLQALSRTCIPDAVKHKILYEYSNASANPPISAAGLHHSPLAKSHNGQGGVAPSSGRVSAAATTHNGQDSVSSSYAVLPTLRAGLAVVDGFLDEAELLATRAAAIESLSEFSHQAGMGGANHQSKWSDLKARGDTMRWLHKDEEERARRTPLVSLMDKVTALRPQLEAQGYDVGGRITYQLACYPGNGSRYVRHRDASDSCPSRSITAICYLNPAWQPLVEGGQLAVYNTARAGGREGSTSGVYNISLSGATGSSAAGPQGYLNGEPASVLAPLGGRLVVFQSRLEHEVLPAQGVRYALTVWLHKQYEQPTPQSSLPQPAPQHHAPQGSLQVRQRPAFWSQAAGQHQRYGHLQASMQQAGALLAHVPRNASCFWRAGDGAAASRVGCAPPSDSSGCGGNGGAVEPRVQQVSAPAAVVTAAVAATAMATTALLSVQDAACQPPPWQHSGTPYTRAMSPPVTTPLAVTTPCGPLLAGTSIPSPAAVSGQLPLRGNEPAMASEQQKEAACGITSGDVIGGGDMRPGNGQGPAQLCRTSNALATTTQQDALVWERGLTSERGVGLIFVSIAAYRDAECQWTIKDLFDKASRPQSLRVGVVWQVDPIADSAIVRMAGSKAAPGRLAQIREIRLPHLEATGPCKARHLAQALWDGEEYVLQIDAHMRFVPGWDVLCLQQLSQATALSATGKAVLSTYPLPYSGEGPAARAPTSAPPTLLCAKGFASDGLLRVHARSLAAQPHAPLPSSFWAAGFSFSLAALMLDVPYSPHLPHLFFGEELYMLARMWTRGWDVFAPSCPIVFHQWERHSRASTYQLDFKTAAQKKDAKLLSQLRVLAVLGAASWPATPLEAGPTADRQASSCPKTGPHGAEADGSSISTAGAIHSFNDNGEALPTPDMSNITLAPEGSSSGRAAPDDPRAPKRDCPGGGSSVVGLGCRAMPGRAPGELSGSTAYSSGEAPSRGATAGQDDEVPSSCSSNSHRASSCASNDSACTADGDVVGRELSAPRHGVLAAMSAAAVIGGAAEADSLHFCANTNGNDQAHEEHSNKESARSYGGGGMPAAWAVGGRWGLGTSRTLSELQQHMGVNFPSRSISNVALLGGLQESDFLP